MKHCAREFQLLVLEGSFLKDWGQVGWVPSLGKENMPSFKIPFIHAGVTTAQFSKVGC